MDETKYYKTVYNKFWEKQVKKYGYSLYEQRLVQLISKSSPKEVFEVGIGTGWPIGTALKAKGIKVDGCDIARSAVKLAKQDLENESGIWVGDVTKYNGTKLYDVTYCVRSSWYMPDIYRVIKKMISMTKPEGYIVFDIMDKNSLCCIKVRCVLIKERLFRFLGLTEAETFGHHFITLNKMKRFLNKNGLSYRSWGERELTYNQDKLNTPKVVFYCRKGSIS